MGTIQRLMLTGPEYQNTSTLPISQLGSRSTQALWSTGSTALMWGIPTTQCPTRGTRISMLNIRPWPSKPRVSSLWAGWPATNTSTWTRPSSMLLSSLTLTSRLSTGVATLSDLLSYVVLHYLKLMFDCFLNCQYDVLSTYNSNNIKLII